MTVAAEWDDGLTASTPWEESRVRRWPRGTPIEGPRGGGRFRPSAIYLDSAPSKLGHEGMSRVPWAYDVAAQTIYLGSPGSDHTELVKAIMDAGYVDPNLGHAWFGVWIPGYDAWLHGDEQGNEVTADNPLDPGLPRIIRNELKTRLRNPDGDVMTAAAWDESKHPRRPAGSPSSQGGEFSARRAARTLPEGFPAGELDPGGRVTFWPAKIGTVDGAPLWKGMIDAAGNEVAWWFADPYGLPHHSAVYKAIGAEGFLIDVSGYGDRLDAELANARHRPAMEQMIERHRRDLRDASEMTMALAAAVWDETKHPRDPGGEGGGQWIPKNAPKLGEKWARGTSVMGSTEYRNGPYSIIGRKVSGQTHTFTTAYAVTRDGARVGVASSLDKAKALAARDVDGTVPSPDEILATLESGKYHVDELYGGSPAAMPADRFDRAMASLSAAYEAIDPARDRVSGRRNTLAEVMRRGRLERSGAMRAAAWDESKHPRHPAGSETGGEFAPKYGPTPAWATALDAGRAADEAGQQGVDVMRETEQRLNTGQSVPYDLDPAYRVFSEWADSMKKWYTETEGFPPDYWPTQRDRLWNDYVNSVERGGSALRARLSAADVPGLTMTPQLSAANGGDLDALMDPARTHAPDFDVSIAADPAGHPDDRPGFTVWTHEDGSVEVEDILDVGDTTYFPGGPESPTAAAYVRAIDAARGQTPTDNSTVTIYRGMSDSEMDAWVSGAEIPAGKFFTDRPTTSYAMDVNAAPPVLQTFSVPRSMLIEVAPGEFQLRRRGKMRAGRIEPVVGAGFNPGQPRDPGGEGGGQWVKAGSSPEPSAFMRGMRRAAESRPPVPPGFPPGVFDPNDSVAFWPDELAAYSGFSQTREGPFWKAIVDDNTGDEVAYWFADLNGRPHHEDMNAALGRDEFMPQTFVAGYGDEPDLSGYLVEQATTEADFAASDIEALMEDGNSHELYDRFGLLMGDYEGMTHEEIRDELVKEKLDMYRQIPRRHRRDIADAREIIAGREALSADAGPPDPVTPDVFNALVADERDALEAFEPTLTRQYRARLRELGRQIASQFEDVAAPALAAAAPPADWQPPTVEELLAGIALVAPEETDATRRKAFERVVDGILRRLGLSFDVTAILSQTILNGLGARSDGIIEGMRAVVARIVANSYLNGLSVPQTAAAIVEGLDGISGWQATQLARNDLVGMANGGSLLAARIVRDAYPTVGLAYKEWLATDDERVRPTHWAAHQQRVPLETPFVVGAATLAYPGDPSGPDEEVINCRCTLIYRAEPAAVTAAWNEAEHPRDPGGEGGGEFIEKGSTAPDERAQMPWRETLSKLTDYTADDVRAGKVPGITEGELREGVAAHARDVAITVAKAENGHGAYLASGRLDTVLIAHEAGHYVANEIQRESDRGMAIPELDPFRTDPGYEILDPKPTAQGRIKVRRKSDGAEMYVFPKPATYENPWGLNPDPGEILADTYSRLLHDDPFSAEALKDEPEFAKPRQALLDRVARTAEKMGLPHKRLYRVTADGSEALTAAAWDESQHPRHPGGAPLSQGGEFAPVVEATVDDATEVAIGRLDDEVRTWPIGEPRRYAREALASIPMRPNPGELVVTARRNGELVAVGSARLHPEPGPMQEPDTLMGDYAGAIRGGGLPLFRAMVEYAAERNLGMFWTAGNDDAARLYDRLGARRQGSNGYYLRPEDVRGLLDDTFRYAREPLAASAFDGLRWPPEWWIPGPADMTAAVWREEEHPRDPGGEGGGQFIPKDGVGVGDEQLAAEALDAMQSPDAAVFPTISGTVRPSDEQLDRSAEAWLAYPDRLDVIAMRNGLPSADAYIAAAEAKAKEDLFSSEVTIRTPVELVDEIAADWRFKSQFETQTSRGTLDNDIRSHGEESLFSYPASTAPEDRPIYGYMQKPSYSGGFEGGVEQYGEVKWELKRDVRARTTFTQGDSLSLVRAPAPVDAPDFRALAPPYPFNGPAARDDRDILRHEGGVWGDVNYVEAQIHGGVTMDDVAAVILPRYLRDTIENGTRLPGINPQAEQDRRLAAAVAKLKQYGVTVEYA